MRTAPTSPHSSLLERRRDAGDWWYDAIGRRIRPGGEVRRARGGAVRRRSRRRIRRRHLLSFPVAFARVPSELSPWGSSGVGPGPTRY